MQSVIKASLISTPKQEKNNGTYYLTKVCGTCSFSFLCSNIYKSKLILKSI